MFNTLYMPCIFHYMPRIPRRPSSSKSPPPVSGARRITAPAATRGITAADVDRAADSLLRAGSRPTIERVRLELGRGSPNTINPLLDAWWQRLAGRLDAGPAALHRLPEPVLHAAEALWLQCLDDARRRTQLEAQGSRKALARDRQDLEVQSHVLGIREAELKARIEAAEQRAARLELELDTLTTLLRKEQASRAAAERRAGEYGRAPPPTAGKPTTRRKAKTRPTSPKPARQSARTPSRAKRSFTATKRSHR